MSVEVEAKFVVPNSRTRQRIRELARLGSYALGEPQERPVRDDYFDTAAQALLSAGWACRLRRLHDACIVTLKSVRSRRADVHQREELEAVLPSASFCGPDPQPARWPPSKARDQLLRIAGEQPLCLLFRLEQDRLARDVSDGRRRLAVASLDEVRLELTGASRRWWELEVELSEEGTETDLAAISGWIRASLGLQPASESKFERALREITDAAGGGPRLRRARRWDPAGVRSVVLETTRQGLSDAAAELPTAELAARGYRAKVRRHTRDEVVFHDTHDGALMKKGYVLSWSRSHGTWRVREDGRLQAEEVGPGHAVPVEGAIGAVLGTLPADYPTVALLEASLEQIDYLVSGLGTDPLRVRARQWSFRSPLVAVPERTLLRLTATGPSAALEYFAALLQEQLGYSPSPDALLPRGLALLGIAAPGATPARELRVQAGDSINEALRKILRGEAWKMRMNVLGAVRDLHPEFVHDLRVAIRRARSAGRLFASVLEPAAAAPLREELRWIARLLGEVRDLDVLSSRLQAQLAGSGAPVEFSSRVRLEVAARRASALAALVPELESGRFSRLLQALESADGVGAAGNGAVGAFARRRIDKAFRKLVPWMERGASALGEADLHRIRILFKRLRYACEFFRPLLGSPVEALIDSFVAFQDCLGLHQDAVAAARRLNEILQQVPAAGRTEDFLLSMGSLIQVQRGIQQAQREKFLALWEDVSRLRESWKKLRAQAGAAE